METNKWSVLARLRKAVKKITFLMNFSISRWRLASMIGRTSVSKRQISFNDRPGLRACTPDNSIDSEGSGSSKGLQRTISYPSEDDVDKKAEMFIANFYRQLQIERQISLELKYCRGDSFKAISP